MVLRSVTQRGLALSRKRVTCRDGSALDAAIYAGGHVRDSRGNLYPGRFGSDRAWEGNAGLAILTVGG